MKKIAVIYPGFPHYRKGIINELIHLKEYDFHFIGNKDMMNSDIKPYNFPKESKFYNCPILSIHRFLFHRKLIGYIIKGKYDIFIFHSSPHWITILISVFIAKLKKKKVINWTHGILNKDKMMKTMIYKSFFKII